MPRQFLRIVAVEDDDDSGGGDERRHQDYRFYDDVPKWNSHTHLEVDDFPVKM